MENETRSMKVGKKEKKKGEVIINQIVNSRESHASKDPCLTGLSSYKVPHSKIWK